MGVNMAGAIMVSKRSDEESPEKTHGIGNIGKGGNAQQSLDGLKQKMPVARLSDAFRRRPVISG